MFGAAVDAFEKTTGVDVPDVIEDGADKLDEAINETGKAVQKGAETVAKGTKDVVDGVIEVAGNIGKSIGDLISLPGLPGGVIIPTLPGENPGQTPGTDNVTDPGDADGTEPTEAGESLLEGVDLFDFDSLDDAIARGQEMIANGEGSAQLFGELQLLLQSQMQMVSLISNMQKVQHDTAMAAINNIR